MKGNLQWFNYTPEDIFWGELGGLMESIDGGTTCIVDHAHMTGSPDKGKHALNSVSIRELKNTSSLRRSLGYARFWNQVSVLLQPCAAN